MKITVNGKENSSFNAPIYVTELLEKLKLSDLPVVVELNKVALRPREYSTTQIEDGAIIEIIIVAAGG